MKSIFVNQQRQIRSGWKIALVFLFMLAELIALGIVGGIIFAVYGDASQLLNGGFEIQSTQFDWLNIAGGIIQSLLIILAAILCWKLFDRKPLREMGLTSIRTGFRELLLGLAFGAVSITVVFIVLVSFGGVSISGSLFEPKPSWMLLTGAVLFIFVGFSEEILSRGYFMTVLKQTNTKWIPIVVSSVLFSAIHSANPNITLLGFFNIFLVGILFAAMFIKSGSLWMPIGYHITWNYFQGYVYGMQVSGMETAGLYNTKLITENLFNGGKFGPEGGLAVTAVIILGLLAVWKMNSNWLGNKEKGLSGLIQ